MKFLWKIGGEAGFGIMTTGLVFEKIATRSGYHVYDYPEYPSLIRGGHNTYDVTISDKEVHSSNWEVDLLVCLNKETYTLHKHRLHEQSLVIYDPEEFDFVENVVKVPVPFKKLKKEFEIFHMMLNTIATGASIAILGGNVEIFNDILRDQFKKKGEEVINFNLRLSAAGYDYVKNNHAHLIKNILTPKQEITEKMVMTGNDAFSFAVVAADCRYYAAYPMTPASTVLSSLAGWQKKTGMIIRHSEDEIAVINSALGASFAGVRSAVSTSGGGFALMVEAVSYAGIAEIATVIYMGQRPGPATGMPTWTEQGDLLFTAHSGHGEFPKIVLAPGDIFEMIQMTIKAFDMADVYQTPVIILSDKLLGESHKSHEKAEIMNFLHAYVPNRGKRIKNTQEETYLRYKLTADGISEELQPGQSGQWWQANSYEHQEDTHTSESAQVRVEQVDKRARKWDVYFKKIASDDARISGNVFYEVPKIYGDADADTVFVSWGSNKGAILEAQEILAEKGIKTAFMHFTHVYPLSEEKLKPMFKDGKRYILIENNSHAQFGQLLRQQTGIEISEKLLRYDGRPFWPKDIVEYVMHGKEKMNLLDKLKKVF